MQNLGQRVQVTFSEKGSKINSQTHIWKFVFDCLVKFITYIDVIYIWKFVFDCLVKFITYIDLIYNSEQRKWIIKRDV